MVLRFPNLRVGLARLTVLFAVVVAAAPIPASAQPATGTSAAQSAAPSAASPATGADAAIDDTVSNEDLLEDAATALLAVTAILDQEAEIRETLAGLDTSLQENAAEVGALPLPDAPSMAEQPLETEAAQALIDAWQTRADAFEAVASLLQTRQGLARDHRQQALLLAAELDLLDAAQARLRPFVETIAERVAAGALVLETVPEPLLPDAISFRAAADIAAAADQLRARAARDAVIAEAAETSARLGDEMIAEAAAAQTQASAWLTEAQERERLRAEYMGMDVDSLSSALSERQTAQDTDAATLTERLQALDGGRATIADAQTALNDLQPPTSETVADQLPNGEMIESLRAARVALALAEATAAYRLDQIAALTALQEPMEAQRESLVPVLELLDRMIAGQIELSVMADVLEEQARETGTPIPESVDTARDPEALARFREHAAALQAEDAALEAELVALAETRSEAQAAADDATSSIEIQRRQVASEEEWASFLSQMRELDDEALRAAFEEAIAAVSRLGYVRDSIAGGAALMADRATAAEAALAALIDPVVLARRTDDEAFDDWLREQGLRVTREAVEDEAQTEADTPAAPVTISETEAERAEAAPADAPQSPVEALLSSQRDWRNQFIVRRLQYFEDDISLRSDLDHALSQYDGQLSLEREAVEGVLAAARRAWGSATTLQSGLGEAEADTEAQAALREAIAPWLDRSRVLDLQDRIQQIDTTRADIATQRQALLELPDHEDIIAALSLWDQQVSEIIDGLSEYLSLRSQASALRNIEEQGELERRMLEREIDDRIAQDQGVYRELTRFFSTEESSTLNELLQRYYTQLILLERQVSILDSRQAVLRTASDTSDLIRTTLTPLATLLEQEADSLDDQLAVETVLVRAALSPSDAPDLLDAFTEETGIEVDATAVPASPEGEDEDSLAASRLALLETLRGDWARATGYHAWARLLDREIEPLGGLDDRIGQYRDLVAELESTKAELNRTIGRLAGYDPAQLDQLVTTGLATSPERLALGEIGLLQIELREVLQWRAVESGISLILIPFVAIILITIIRLFGRRLVKRAIAAPTPDGEPLSPLKKREREERAATLSGIFTKIMSTVVILLSIVYMLKVINIDVTPIVASFGILGLAVAFGAQAMMRDLFSGFFLLMENQMNRDDWVKINNKWARVERIGLRATVVRDWATGNEVHYPNSQIPWVENFSRGWVRSLNQVYVPFDHDPEYVRVTIDTAIKAYLETPDGKANIKAIYGWAPGPGGFDFDVGAYIFDVNMELYGDSIGPRKKVMHYLAQELRKAGIQLAVPVRRAAATPMSLVETPDGPLEPIPANLKVPD